MIILRNSRHGQTLIVAVIFIALLSLTIPWMVYTSNWSVRNNIKSLTRKQSISVAEEGLSFIASRLTNATLWDAVLQAGGAPLDTGATTTPTPSGKRFRIRGLASTTTPGLASYQIRVDASALDNKNVPVSAVRAWLSRKTIGVQMPNGLHSRTALWLDNSVGAGANVPANIGTGQVLNVLFGSIAQKNSGFNLLLANTGGTNIDQNRYARKFSAGGITSSLARTSTTDNREYWTQAALGFAMPIQTDTYALRARNVTNPPALTCVGGGSCAPDPVNSSYYSGVGNATFAEFTAGGGGYVINNPSVFYVMGSARFKNGHFDFKNTTLADPDGGMIITGNLEIQGDSGGFHNAATSAGGQTLANFRVPLYFQNEWPYGGAPALTPNSAGASTAIIGGDGKVMYRGFLWVQGNMTIKAGNDYVMSGVLRVDGQLTFEANSSLTIYLDDEVSAKILMSSYDVVIDNMAKIEPF